MTRPCRVACFSGPANTALTRPPTPIAVMNSPRVRGLPPNRSALIAGNSDTGSAKNVAFTSARNAPHSTGVRRMNASPSSVSASPDRGRAPAPSAVAGCPAAARTVARCTAGGAVIAGGGPHGRHRGQPAHAPQRPREGRGVRQVAAAQSRPRGDDAGERRPDDHYYLEDDPVQRHRRAQLLLGHEPGDEGLLGRRANRAERGPDRDERVERPQGRAPEGREREQHRRAHGLSDSHHLH